VGNEIPIKNYLVQGDIARRLHGTTDGRVWAQFFLRAVAVLPTGELDLSTQAAEDDAVDWVTTWFANAIEVGRDAGYRAGLADRQGPI
jgi:hypothetical protein